MVVRTMPPNPRFVDYPHYGANVKADYEWYSRDVASAISPCMTQKAALVRALEVEYFKLTLTRDSFDYIVQVIDDQSPSSRK